MEKYTRFLTPDSELKMPIRITCVLLSVQKFDISDIKIQTVNDMKDMNKGKNHT